MQVQRQIDRLLAQRAAEWMETLKDGERRDREAFVEWLQQSKLHVEHYLDMECLDRQIGALDPAQGPDVEALLAAARPNVVSLQSHTDAGNLRRSIGGRRPFAAAAAIAAVALAAVLIALSIGKFGAGQRIATALGEQRTLTLPDGSLIRMNVDTKLQIRYSAKERAIRLDSGEAVFKVAADAARPFTVHTPTAKVRALGTQFNVYQRDSTMVSVLEGRVQLTPESLQGSAPSRVIAANLSAGEEAQVNAGRIERRAHPDVAKTVAWRERRLYFDDMPLPAIVREFNRYGGPKQLRLEGIAEGTHQFGGTFNADDPAALADILEQQGDLIVERRTNEIFIRAR